MHTDGSQSECFWEEQDSLWPGIILTFDSKETFSACVVSPLSFTQTGFYLSLSLPWLFSWGVYKRQRLAIYPVSVITSLLESKWEDDYKFLSGAHLSLASGTAERRLANCEFPTWSLSIGYLTTWRLCKYWASFHLELFSRRKILEWLLC